ncbi:MAG TPA: HlyD family efflux transporter periplasmic adaptor subunit, partial [Prosthecobacter sp.]|nr:HlyD family efflux transporter periplasmic adaptor subunit [Prosthecobacter sp.]
LRAPQDGVVLTPDLDRLAAGSLRAGDTLCTLAAEGQAEVFFPLSQRQARHVRAGQKMELRAASRPGVTFTGTVAEDAKTPPAESLPPNLAATLGGDIAAQPDDKGGLKPLEVTYGVLVRLPDPDGLLRPGMTGTGRLHGDRVTLGAALWMRLLDFISLDYRW